jgi:hypothetical protein
MDTRIKIAAESDWQPDAQWTAVAGYFDPLLAAHVERLAELPRPLVVFLADPPEPLLDARSRAELVASLDVVDRVVMPREDGSPAAESLARDDSGADLAIRDGLIALVHSKHAS